MKHTNSLSKISKKKTSTSFFQPQQQTDRDFSAFPHQPYPIQTAFMQALYSALDEKRLALFESPTGTGKTLSLVVGALTWLEDKRKAAEAAAEEEEEEEGAAATTTTAAAAAMTTTTTTNAAADSSCCDLQEVEALPPWLAEAAAERAREARGAREARRQRRLRKARERRDAALDGVSRAEWAARARKKAAKEAAERARAGSNSAFSNSARERRGEGEEEEDGDEQFLINSDNDDGDESGALLPNPSSSSSSRRRRRPRALSPSFSSSSGSDDGDSSNEGSGDESESENSPSSRRIRVVVASRTHSQLSQFVGELRRTRFAEEVAAVALGSRAQLCVNDKVLGTENGGRGFSASTVAERCRDLQKKRSSSSSKKQKEEEGKCKKKNDTTKSTCGCPFRTPADPGARRALRDSLLSRPTDVEEAAAAGKSLGACPYYSSRAALPDADVIFVPYAGLLSADAREAVGLKLKGAVVIVDEAHNLPSAVTSAYAARVSARHLAVSVRALKNYLERFGTRLAPSGRRDVQMLLAVAESLGRWLERGGGSGSGGSLSSTTTDDNNAPLQPQPRPRPPQQRALTIDAFVSSTGLDNINTFRLMQSLKEKHVVAKVAGAADAAAARERRKAAAEAKAAEVEGSVRPSGRRGKKGSNAFPRFPPPRRDLNDDGENSSNSEPSATAALHALVAFSAALTTADADGRVVVEKSFSTAASSSSSTSSSSPPDAALRFVLLNAGARFGAVLAQARAVVLASGTLEPSASLAAQLFPPPPPPAVAPPLMKSSTTTTTAKVSTTTTTTTKAPLLPLPQPPPPPLVSSSSPLATAARFSCGHVLPPERLLALSLGTGPTGRTLDLRASARGSAASIDEIGSLIANVCAVVPGGVVAFFPSFAFLRQATERWKETGAMRRMEAKKKVFVEPRAASEVAPTLAAFGRAARGLSEIEEEGEGEGDSSDDDDDDDEEDDEEKKKTFSSSSSFFAPVVAVAAPTKRPPALPPSSISTTSTTSTGALLLSVIGAKLSEGINFGDSLGRAVVVLGIPYPAPDDAELVERMQFLEKRSKGAGRALYEDSAAVAVNQCVGRVVRHAGDWAAVILADVRYTRRSSSGGGGGGGGGVVSSSTMTSTTTSTSSSAPASVPPAERLPGWMKPSLRVASSYGEAHSALARFCREMARRDEEEEKRKG